MGSTRYRDLISMKLGKAFSDAIIAEKTTRRVHASHMPSWWLGAGRALFFTNILFVSLFILLWRLFDLTLIQGHRLRGLAEGNRTREIISHAPRGKILDRTGKVLADSVPTIRMNGNYRENDYDRRYTNGTSTFHVIGYTGEISKEELLDPYFQLRGYLPGDRLGRTGAEAVFEERLRGKNGKDLVEITSSGDITRTLGHVPEIPGEDIELSVDRGLVLAVQSAFPEGEKGAVIVSRPTTGEVLAIYSSPALDMNIFTESLSEEQYDALANHPDRPMFNRGIGGVYPPGSTFKIITALAALEEGAISHKTLIEDVGILKIGPYSFPNWYFIQYGKTDGLVDVIKALKRSNDIFFYKTGEAIGITKLSAWARRLGLGTALGIELPGEAIGLMPDPAWKATQFDSELDKEVRNDQWYLGDTYHVSIGQGYLLTTPLQVNAWTNVIANGGKLCKPTIVKNSQTCKNLEIKKETMTLITEGMKQACEPGGTGWPLFEFGIQKLDQLDQLDKLVKIPIACKTGTAEFGDPQDRTHAWFTAFAPIVEPEISVTVLVEGAGEGSDKAAPIAKKILEEWFSR